MLSINPKEISEYDVFKILKGTVIPRPIAFVTTISKENVVNGAPFSYFNIVAPNPPMISLSVQRVNGELKDTAKNIYQTNEFVVHIVDRDNVEKINETAATLPYNQSELELAKLTQVKSEKVSVPGVKESKVRMECKLVKVIALGDEDPVCDLIIGEVVQFHLDEAVYEENGRINAEALNAVSRLAGAEYAKIGELFSIERPE
ncbi:flavin reductase family protein [Ureibacillus acetophenoni]|uniref:Flavin reductase (DIM6/NTAB) family NADH-FMN oxidoreductase RutF n=1 Tax=Ureibacillus acetophenoni TaxID=614649 RepID=A0A285UKX5_9BACL|nr:flavin reductase family protein [Ureibacillus acetophenoni]SOC42347.1 flavin reductase (DIM6/NTAB) family NADH-FMN oxidoreductase RutF [Ureibacillus acetophenoni]